MNNRVNLWRCKPYITWKPTHTSTSVPRPFEQRAVSKKIEKIVRVVRKNAWLAHDDIKVAFEKVYTRRGARMC